MSTNKSTWKKLTSMRLFMPLVCLLAIIIVATITIPGFLSMSLKNGVPYGYPVDVINRASELPEDRTSVSELLWQSQQLYAARSFPVGKYL